MQISESTRKKRERKEKLSQMRYKMPHLYDLMIQLNKKTLTLGLLTHIWDYECNRNNDGRYSKLSAIYPTMERARKNAEFNNEASQCMNKSHYNDIEDCNMFFATPLTVSLGNPDKKEIIMGLTYTVILDGIEPYKFEYAIKVGDLREHFLGENK